MTAAPTKADYEMQGRRAFKAGTNLTGRFGVTVAKTWQQRAFLTGWKEARGDLLGFLEEATTSAVKDPGAPPAIPKRQYKSKLGSVPLRNALGLGRFEDITSFPLVVIKHLDDLSMRHQFAVSPRLALRYKCSAERVARRWQLKTQDSDSI